MEHVGVREDEVRAPADRAALLARRVAVVDRRADLLAQPEARAARAPGPARAPSSGTGTARAPSARCSRACERRQVEAQRLARRGAGRDDEVGPPTPRGPPRPGARRAARCPARSSASRSSGCRSAGSRRGAGGALALERLADEPLVGAAGLEQGVPGLGLRVDDGHRSIVGVAAGRPARLPHDAGSLRRPRRHPARAGRVARSTTATGTSRCSAPRAIEACHRAGRRGRR